MNIAIQFFALLGIVVGLLSFINSRKVLSVIAEKTEDIVDGVSDVYEITDCSKSEINNVCRDLQDRGIYVVGIA